MLPVDRQNSADAAYDVVVQTAKDVLAQTSAMKKVAGIGCQVEYLVRYHAFLRSTAATWAQLATVPGLGQYIKDERGDQSYDVAAAYQGMLDAGTPVILWIRQAIPNSAGSYAAFKLVAGDFQRIELTKEQLAPLVPLLDGLSASITG